MKLMLSCKRHKILLLFDSLTNLFINCVKIYIQCNTCNQIKELITGYKITKVQANRTHGLKN